MNKILIYGAGALGRGYLAPVFNKLGYQIFFTDKNPDLVDRLNQRRSYKTAQIIDNHYIVQNVYLEKAFVFGEEDSILEDMDLILTSAGQRNIPEIAAKLRNSRAIISFENDPHSVNVIKTISANDNSYFGIPDVIVSNLPPPELLELDPLCVVSESGELVIEKGDYYINDGIRQVDKKEMDEHWACKFYLHNAPHAAVAYLGWKHGYRYIHAAMEDSRIYEIVVEIIRIITKCLIQRKAVNPALAKDYSNRELIRFKNPLLFDPIERVAREPLRKLRPNDRLIASLRMSYEQGEDVSPLCNVIRHVFEYNNPLNDDGICELVMRYGKGKILSDFCGIDSEEKIYESILNCEAVI